MRLQNDTNEHRRVQGALLEFCAANRLSDECAQDLRLLLEEVFTNVVNHAYGEGEAGWIDVFFERRDVHVVITVEDDGAPFDPLIKPMRDLSLEFHQREIGGHGLVLIKALSDEVDYDHSDGRNRLRVSYRTK